jgi:hypothetical protein
MTIGVKHLLLFSQFVGWLVGWLIDWLVGWLVDCGVAIPIPPPLCHPHYGIINQPWHQSSTEEGTEGCHH